MRWHAQHHLETVRDPEAVVTRPDAMSTDIAKPGQKVPLDGAAVVSSRAEEVPPASRGASAGYTPAL